MLPTSTSRGGPLTALGAEFVGNYALRINFSNGHSTGIYSWDYLRSIDPNTPSAADAAGPTGPPGAVPK